MVGDLNWQDYAVQVDVKVDCFGTMAVLIRSKDPSEGIQLQVSNTSMTWVIYQEGRAKTIATANQGLYLYCPMVRVYSGVPPPPSKTYRLKVEARGNIFSAYLDGTLVSRMQDRTFLSWRVGLGTTSGSDSIRFDTFTVSTVR